MILGITTSEATLLLLLAIVMVIAGWLALAFRRWIVRQQRRHQWSRARVAEQVAPRLLAKRGFEVIGSQVESEYSLIVDGESVIVSLRADYVVARNGRQYVAEVKSGKWAPRLDTAATRRQLLEYLVAFRVDGVLLVDGESGQVHEVEFPISKHTANGASTARIWLRVGALAFAVAAIWMLCNR